MLSFMKHILAALIFLCGVSAAAEKPGLQLDPDIRLRFSRNVTFEFAESDFDDVMNFILNFSRATIILDSKVKTSDLPRINLKIQDITLKEALDQALEKAGVEAIACDGAIFVFKKGAYAIKPPEAPPPLSKEQAGRFAEAFASINADEFDARERATKSILQLGRGSVPLIENALSKDCDAETRLRLKKIILALTPRPLFDEPLELTEALDGLENRVTFCFSDQSIEECVKFLKTLNSGRLSLAVDDSVSKQTVNVRVNDLSLGNAIRWTARQAGIALALKDGMIRFCEAKK
jgi:hypothetical protein